jgi:hypothetical protein
VPCFMAEKEGFEPSIRYNRIPDFESEAHAMHRLPLEGKQTRMACMERPKRPASGRNSRTRCGYPAATLARSIRSRTQAAPPSFASFARCPGVMRRLTVTVSTPGAKAFRPWPRSFGGRLVFMS